MEADSVADSVAVATGEMAADSVVAAMVAATVGPPPRRRHSAQRRCGRGAAWSAPLGARPTRVRSRGARP